MTNVDETPVEALSRVISQMEEVDLHGMFYGDIGLGGPSSKTMIGLNYDEFRDELGGLLSLLDKFEFYFAAPCPLDGWVLVVTHRRRPFIVSATVQYEVVKEPTVTKAIKPRLTRIN